MNDSLHNLKSLKSKFLQRMTRHQKKFSHIRKAIEKKSKCKKNQVFVLNSAKASYKTN